MTCNAKLVDNNSIKRTLKGAYVYVAINKKYVKNVHTFLWLKGIYSSNPLHLR